MVKEALSAPGDREGEAGDGAPGVGALWILSSGCSAPLPPLPRARESICLLRLVVQLGQILRGWSWGLSESPTQGTMFPS